jgi:hypothetical protein
MTDPVELLRQLYPLLDNGQKTAAKEAKEYILEMRSTIADLESTIARQPLPEAPASITVKVVDPLTQFEYLVTVREARAGLALIGRIPDISAALTGLGLVATDSRGAGGQGGRGEKNSFSPAPPHPGSPAIPNCPDGHGAMKASTKVEGEFYCSAVVGTHPQTGKKLYCTHKARPIPPGDKAKG